MQAPGASLSPTQPLEPALEAIWADLEVLSSFTKSFVDEYGTSYAYLEGGYGGETVLLWAPRAWAVEALRALRPLRYRGRVVLALDASPGDLAPFERALYWTAPRRALIVVEGRGVGARFGGWKAVNGERRPLEAPEPADAVQRTAPTGLVYVEERRYPAWEAPAPEGLPLLEGPHQGHAAWARGVPTYGVGLVSLSETLAALLGTWGLLEGES
ncbi:hypothetical protein [Marinithermus hydrothermalis]|uniref:Uncharacterized protein n=1 Tax=Marinithermus hydrothermalis (strain DSM 14884 / JCM 11576 / T1) TaxID=869210 RepID=F2NNC0_MARHT|nr:hypothetical protein [Marinithermus hydrothermalis]AEB10961.1 hypothetical protein Marky_0200 [Marinithermus hydrothermalis DSM 14884]